MDKLEFSSFCYLDATGKEALEALVSDVEKLVEDCIKEMIEGSDAAYSIAQKHYRRPTRNHMESGNKYEADINAWVQNGLLQHEQLLYRKWETCSVAVDCIEELIRKQEEAKAFLIKAQQGVPHGAHRYSQIVKAAPLSQRAALNDLHARLQEFTDAPLQAVYDKQMAMLSEVSGQITQLCNEHPKYWQYAADFLTEGDDRKLLEFTARKVDAYDKLDTIEENFVLTISALPDLLKLYTHYRQTSITQRNA